MRYRPLGKTALQISEIAHGTWAMGFMWGARDDVQSLATLQAGFARGINFVDTAYLYGKGHSERLIARAKREAGRPDILVATKCPPKTPEWPPKPGTHFRDAFPEDYLMATTELSRQNLEVEQIDLQQLHLWRDEWLDEPEFLSSVEKLKKSGLVRHFGVSLNDHDADSGLRLVQSGLIDSVQVIFNLFEQRPMERLFPLCREQGVGVLVRVPLDEGGLSGTLTPKTEFAKGDWRKHYFSGDRLRETCERAAGFEFLIRGEIQSLAQAAIKFCLSEPAVSSVLVGMRQSAHVQANTAVSDFADFSAEDLARAHGLAWLKNFYV